MTRGKKQVAFQQYLLYDQLIPEASTYKYLGVHINSHLNWNDHVNVVDAKAKRTLGFIWQIAGELHPDHYSHYTGP